MKTVLTLMALTTCFTPQDNCTQKIVDTIGSAKETVYVQAYSFTSFPIANALIAAKQRGVSVSIIFDKSEFNTIPGTCEKLFAQNSIHIWDDYLPSIAHNKVMIIDDNEVITGSFNFTHAAQFNNTENVLFIQDTVTAEAYLKAWNIRKGLSKEIQNG